MRSVVRFFPVVLVLFLLTGCRQADGAMPAPDAGRLEELGDIARDLQNVASGRDPQAPKDLADDLRKYTQERTTATAAVDELSRRIVQAIAAREIAEQPAQQLALDLWVAITARELSDRQVETLQNDVQTLLGSVGVAEDSAMSVAAQIGDVQQVATDRSRRWYEVF